MALSSAVVSNVSSFRLSMSRSRKPAGLVRRSGNPPNDHLLPPRQDVWYGSRATAQRGNELMTHEHRPAGFAGAPVTKGLLILVGIASVACALADYKRYVPVIWDPHLKLYRQVQVSYVPLAPLCTVTAELTQHAFFSLLIASTGDASSNLSSSSTPRSSSSGPSACT
jgi:hypothetical protein